MRDKAKQAASDKRWKEKNREHVREVAQIWRQKNGDKIQAQKAAYKAKPKTTEQKERAAAKSRRSRKRFIEKIREYKGNHPCVDCGESDPIVLQFDHIDPSKKEFSVTYVSSWPRALREIEDNCDVVCANCHARRTHKQRTENPEYFKTGKSSGKNDAILANRKPNADRRGRRASAGGSAESVVTGVLVGAEVIETSPTD